MTLPYVMITGALNPVQYQLQSPGQVRRDLTAAGLDLKGHDVTDFATVHIRPVGSQFILQRHAVYPHEIVGGPAICASERGVDAELKEFMETYIRTAGQDPQSSQARVVLTTPGDVARMRRMLENQGWIAEEIEPQVTPRRNRIISQD